MLFQKRSKISKRYLSPAIVIKNCRLRDMIKDHILFHHFCDNLDKRRKKFSAKFGQWDALDKHLNGRWIGRVFEWIVHSSDSTVCYHFLSSYFRSRVYQPVGIIFPSIEALRRIEEEMRDTTWHASNCFPGFPKTLASMSRPQRRWFKWFFSAFFFRFSYFLSTERSQYSSHILLK